MSIKFCFFCIDRFIWLFFFEFSIWRITLIDFQCEPSLHPWNKSTFSWFTILLIYCLILLANILRSLHLYSWGILRCSFLIICFYDLNIRIYICLIEWDSTKCSRFYFLKDFTYKWCYLFPEGLLKFTREVFWAWDFFVRQF